MFLQKNCLTSCKNSYSQKDRQNKAIKNTVKDALPMQIVLPGVENTKKAPHVPDPAWKAEFHLVAFIMGRI